MAPVTTAGLGIINEQCRNITDEFVCVSSIYCMQHAYQQAITIDLLMLENAAALIELRSRKSVNVADSDTGI